MNLKERWFPELLLFPDVSSRKAGWRAAFTDNESLRVYYLVALVPVAVVVSFFTTIPFGKGGGLALAVMAGLPLIVSLALAILFRRAVREKLRLELHFYGVRTCIECGYQMGDLPSKTCPECGATVFSKRDTT